MSDTPKVFKCKECGGEFPYQPLDHPTIPGGKLDWTPAICEGCTPIFEARRKQEYDAKLDSERENLWAEICPPLFQRTKDELLPQRQLAEAMAWEYNPKGLLLHGSTGRGKTRIVWRILRKQFLNGLRFEAMTAGEFSRKSSDSAANGYAEDWAEKLVRVRLLFIDDLGKGKLTERNEADLFDIIDRRIAFERPIIVTTNSVGDELQKRLDPDRGAPLIRRLREFCDCISF